MGRPHAKQINGLRKYASGLTWWPDSPLVAPIDVITGGATDITVLGVGRQDPLKLLEYKDPRTGIYYVTNQLNTVKSFNLTAKNVTYPFAVLVWYNYINNTVGIRQGNADADIPRIPELAVGEIKVGVHIEPKQGDVYTPPVVEPVNYFRWKALTKAAGTYSDIVDFSQSKVYLTLTGDITIANPSTYLSGDFLPDGKTLMLCVRGSAYTITWSSNFVKTDNSLDFSSQATKWNKVIITKNELSGKYEYCNTDTVTA